MANTKVLKTDFCIGGFPKCGTSALARFLERSPGCHIARHAGSVEFPLYSGAGTNLEPDYREGLINGHKFSAYALMGWPLERIYESNQNVLFMFCIRDAADVLVSWHRMHKNMAIRGTPTTHFVNEDPIARDFYRTCDLESYFDEYAGKQINHAERLFEFKHHLPHARFLVISQERLAQDAEGVMRRVHAELNLDVAEEYYDKLPLQHASFAGRQGDIAVGARVRKELEIANYRMIDFLNELDFERNLTLYERRPAPIF